jgi:threonylcarbamoyladenosine tRNA methylthiotransferase MtaB
VIAGFPGETEADFAATLDFARKMPFTYLHVFSFSARPGTEAAKLPGMLPGNVIRERARALRAVSAEKSHFFRASQAGRDTRALTLSHATESWTEALTPNYMKVRIAGRHAANQWHVVRLTANPEDIIASRPL